ncbi:MAG: sigma-70 family RNA polymerase sigma factor [Clostridia bacterium]|nr:sigma-70 family RNA polymerase sigma factor [Clostridia bacterium]
MAYKVKLCGIDTSALPQMSTAESNRILEEIAAGDDTHRDYFLTSNLRLVLSIIHRFNFDSDRAEDVFQVGCWGLVKALNNFDPKYGVLFSTYAVPMIIGEIRRYLRESTALKVSRSMRDTAYQVMQAKEALRLADVYEPTYDQIAAYIGIDTSEIVCALDAMADPISIDEPAFADGDESATVRDQIAECKDREEKMVEHIALEKALTYLTPKEREIIDLRYYQGRTQTEISRMQGVSQAQISRIESAAIRRLRQYML